MALNTQVSVSVRNGQAEVLRAALAGGRLRIYSGTQPANPDTAITSQVLLAELTLSNPAFAEAANGSIVANTITGDTSANATGTATWYRAFAANGTTAVIDGTVGTSASNLIVNSTAFTNGAAVNVTSWTHTVN